jgi:DMSO reductase family type II enzyme chaperone
MTTLAEVAESRSQLFQLLALGFTHPVEAFHRVLVDDSYRQALVSAASVSRCPINFSHRETDDFAEFESDFILLFQMGRRGKPLVSLNAADHADIARERGRPEVLLEYSGWYRHFGLRANQEAWLAHLEAGAGDEPEMQQGYQRAQRDFLKRHLQAFLESLVTSFQQRAAGAGHQPFYCSLAALSLELTDSMLEQFDTTLAETDRSETGGDSQQIAAVNLWG